jgi:nitroreductase
MNKEMNQMTLKDLIINRVSNLKFTEKHVDLEHIMDCLDVAVYAPNHKMREPWRFIIFQDKGKETFIERYVSAFDASLRNDQKNTISKVFFAPLVIAVVMPKTGQHRDDLEDLQANAAMIQNFLLLLTESGLSTFWKTPQYIESQPFRSSLDIQEHEIVVGLLMIGYSEFVIHPKPRKTARSKSIIYS